MAADPTPGDYVPGLGLDRRSYEQGKAEAEDALTDALVATFESITGRKVTTRVREDLWQAVRGEC